MKQPKSIFTDIHAALQTKTRDKETSGGKGTAAKAKKGKAASQTTADVRSHVSCCAHVDPRFFCGIPAGIDGLSSCSDFCYILKELHSVCSAQ
jgi:hypothetical protein